MIFLCAPKTENKITGIIKVKICYSFLSLATTWKKGTQVVTTGDFSKVLQVLVYYLGNNYGASVALILLNALSS